MAAMSVKTNQTASEDLIPPPKIHWTFFLYYTLVHVTGIICLPLSFVLDWKWRTLVFHLVLGYMGGFGTTIGAHRYFAHRTFKAVRPLRIFLALCHTLAVQHSVYNWVKWHRAHHKHSDTEMDPHNAGRGFFYSHVGWLLFMNWERSAVQTKSVDMSDLEADPFIMWQHRNFYPFAALLTGVIPILIVWLLWEESLIVAVGAMCIRLMLSDNFTFLVNSAAHLWGNRPYSKEIYPRENPLVSVLAIGEGWHNYHHTFPWDFQASEFGPFYRFNPSAAIILLFAKLGLAYDLKTASPKLIKERMKRTGDSSKLSYEEATMTTLHGNESDIHDEGAPEDLAETMYPLKRHVRG